MCMFPFVECPDLTSPEHGMVSYNTHVYESAAQYSCDPGFRLNGPDIATCLWDGNWSDPPTCERIRKHFFIDLCSSNVQLTLTMEQYLK